MPFLELFEPRAAYVSELKLQHAWKNLLWKTSRLDTKGRAIKVLSPGRHNHSDGPDFIGASMIIDGKLINGDIEIHHRLQDWYGHGHHLDKAYDQCILHAVFQNPAGKAETRCCNGNTPPICYIPLEEALAYEPPGHCKIFTPDTEMYFKILKKSGWLRIKSKIRYFYENRLRFPEDIMLYWGMFKACGYRYNEDNMIKLFVQFPWAAYCDELLDKKDILPMLKELAGFSGINQQNGIRWTRSKTRPTHFPEIRVDWLGKMMTYYYGSSLSGMIYEIVQEKDDIFKIVKDLFNIPASNVPGETLRKEIIMNTILPLMEAIRMDFKENIEFKDKIYNLFETTQIGMIYGTVRRFHDEHGIDIKDKRQKNWLISQGALHIKDNNCTQNDWLNCPICLLENKE